MTVQEVKTLYTRHKKDISDVDDALLFDWCDEVNRFAYRIIYGTDPERFINESAISVSVGDSTYALPADFLTMQPRGCGIYETDNGTRTDRALAITGYSSNLVGYYINGTTINITPTPQNATTLYIRYIPSLNTIDGLSDVLIVPDEYIYYVKNAIDVLYDIWDEDVAAEGLQDFRFARALDELARNISKNTETAGIQTFTNAYY